MEIILRVKIEIGQEFMNETIFTECKSAEDQGSYAPFEEIITLLVTIVGTGGITKVLIELIKNTSKKVLAKKDSFGNIEVDCTNCTVEEVKEIIKIIKENSGSE